jgi:hypothetical protein
MVAAGMVPILPKLTVEQAEHWVAAALAEARALRQHDSQLFPRDNEVSAIETAVELHAAWRRWADSADAIYDRVRPIVAAGRHVSGATDLDYAIGRTRAMLQLSPQDNLAAIDEIRRGNVVTAEELRRALRSRA